MRKGGALGVRCASLEGEKEKLVFGKRYDCVIPSLRLGFFSEAYHGVALFLFKSAEFGGHIISVCFARGLYIGQDSSWNKY